MPSESAEKFLESLKGSGLVVVRGDLLYFVPLSVMNKHIFPAAFLKDAPEVSSEYFEKLSPNAGANVLGQVFKRMDELLVEFRRVDGVSQAIWLDEATEKDGKLVSKSSGSAQTMFVYDNTSKKIVVDMAKGGKPSDR